MSQGEGEGCKHAAKFSHLSEVPEELPFTMSLLPTLLPLGTLYMGALWGLNLQKGHRRRYRNGPILLEN